MRLLLDTHALLWWLDDDPRLGRPAREAIANPSSVAVVSAASVWEIAIKQALGRLDPPEPLQISLERERFDELPITHAHALRAGALPPHHKDPFDRMLVAQAELQGLTIVSRDPSLAPYGVAILPA